MNEIINYGEIKATTKKSIFGNEMTFNQLNSLEKRKYMLIVGFIKNDDWETIKVYFDDKNMLNKDYPIETSCDMIEILKDIRPTTGKKVRTKKM